MTIKIGINGLGRIGRMIVRSLYENNYKDIEIKHINNKTNSATASQLLKYDSIHGKFNCNIKSDKNHLILKNKKVTYTQHTNLEDINWKKYNVDYVLECTGKFNSKNKLIPHIKNGAKKVIVSAPCKNADKTIVYGVNHKSINKNDSIISAASCTTNCLAPIVYVLNKKFKIEKGFMTTIHSYTTDQSLHDQPHADLRRARAAGQSIVPTTTGAAKALTKIFPDLSEVIGGCGIRVPVPNGSLTDLTLNVARETTIEEINAAFEHAASHELQGILEFTNVPLVSIDIVGNTHSVIVDAQMTSVIGNLVKLIGWYDNETGYSSRLIDLILKIS